MMRFLMGLGMIGLKTPYELLHDRKPDLSYIHIFGALCYPTNDREDIGTLKAKADIEAVATGCYTQNRSIVRLRHGKTPYELLHNKLPDLSFLYVFGALCYPTNDNENLGKLQPKADIEIFIGYAQHFGFTTDDLLFQPLFNELLTPPPSVDPSAPEVITPINEVVAPELAESTGSPSSTIVDQDAPSPSNDLLFGMPIPKVTSDQSSSTVSSHTEEYSNLTHNERFERVEE
nr:integrase, catalytic region, zinc finger, CCHC-type, peptidase aspartic, catalytic [Tanacetum cinerariifolium]